jgi:hypothetical protein
MSFVDKEQLEPGSAVLLNHKTHAVVGVLADDTDPMVSVMKLEKAPQVRNPKKTNFLPISRKPMPTSVDWINKFKKSKSPSSFRLHIPNTTKKWESNLQKV